MTADATRFVRPAREYGRAVQKFLTLASAAAALVVALVKGVGAATGNQWLGHNWKGMLGGFELIAMSTVGVFAMTLVTLSVLRPLKGQLTKDGAAIPLGPVDRAMFTFWALVAALGIMMIAVEGLAYAWLLGLFSVVYTIGYGVFHGAVEWIKGMQLRRTCPLCYETVHAYASRCKHCHGEITPKLTPPTTN